MTQQTNIDWTDPAIRADAQTFIAADEQAYTEWLAADDFDALIEEAIAAGRAAFKDAADLPVTDFRSTMLMIDMGHRRAKPLVQALAAKGVGEVDILSWTFDIQLRHVLGRNKQATYKQRDAALEAFALAISKPGFEVQVWKE